MKIVIALLLLLFTALILTSCLPNSLTQVTQASTVEASPPVPVISLPSATQSPVITEMPFPLYQPISRENITQIILLHQWRIEEVFTNHATIWFSDSSQFVMPVRKASVYGIQSFRINDFNSAWLTQSDSTVVTVDMSDQVLTYLGGIHVFDRQGIEIQTIPTNTNCQENIASFIVAIPGTDLVVTGHHDSFSDFGLYDDSQDRSSLLLWDTRHHTCASLWKEFAGRLWSLSASYDGRYIGYSFGVRDPATWEWQSTVIIYNLSLQTETCRLVGDIVQFNKQNQVAVYNAPEGTMSVISPLDCTIESQFSSDPIKIFTFVFHPNGYLLAGASESIVGIWDIRTGELLHTLNVLNLPLVSFSPDGRFLVTTVSRMSPAGSDKIMLWGILSD